MRVLTLERGLFTLAAVRHSAWPWGWSSVGRAVVCFKPGKEVVEAFQQRGAADAGLWPGFVVRCGSDVVCYIM